MKDIRCAACNRKLAEGQFVKLVIKCVRCSALNTFTEHPDPEVNSVPPPERPERQQPKRYDHERLQFKA